MGWLIALGILILLAILPLGVHGLYNADGFRLSLILGPVKLKLIPAKHKKDKKEKKEKEKEPEKEKQEEKKKIAKDETSGGSFLDFLPLVKTGIEFLGAFRRKLRIKRLEMKVTMASSDPCDLAVNYGKAWAALGNLMPLLERAFVIKKRDLEVQCDFTASDTVIYARADVTITLGRLLAVVVKYAIRLLRQYLKIQKSRKDGTKK